MIAYVKYIKLEQDAVTHGLWRIAYDVDMYFQELKTFRSNEEFYIWLELSLPSIDFRKKRM